MADNFIFEIGGNIDAFKKTISEVEAELKRVRGTLKNQLGQGLVDANKNIAQLEQSLVNLKQVGLDKLPKAANNGSAALFSLSQVARDAPFGFIAIQNNLPLVVDQFSALSKTSGGLTGALKSVGSALVGPAGLSFAFGAIIAGVTALVQKYGSLGEAFNQILGLTPKLTDAQKKFNEATFETSASLVSENAKVNILISTLTDLKKPQADRLAAYNELKNVAPEIIAGIKDENALTKESLISIEQQAKARKELIKLRIQEAGINAALTTNETKLAELRNKFLIANENYIQAAKGLSKENKNAIITGFASQTQQEINNKTFNDAIDVFKTLQNQISLLEGENNKYLQQLDPVVNGIASINNETQKRINALKDQIKLEKELNKESEVASKKADKRNLDNLKAIIDALKERDAFEKKLDENRKKGEKFNQDVLEKRLKLTEQLTNPSEKLLDILIDESDAYEKVANSSEKFGKKALDAVVKPLGEQQKALEARFKVIQSVIEQSLIAPLEYLFDTVLENGKFSWKEFGNIVIEQLKRIIVQIAATAAATALANVLTKGAYGATVKLGAQVSGANVGAGGVSVGRPSAVNFGGIQGGIGLSGQVVFVQRGTDLVGVLNRSNATINRVG